MQRLHCRHRGWSMQWPLLGLSTGWKQQLQALLANPVTVRTVRPPMHVLTHCWRQEAPMASSFSQITSSLLDRHRTKADALIYCTSVALKHSKGQYRSHPIAHEYRTTATASPVGGPSSHTCHHDFSQRYCYEVLHVCGQALVHGSPTWLRC